MGSAAWWMKAVVEEEEVVRKGPWTLEEDAKLISNVRQYGAARWSSLAKLAGLKRDGKSCRMRWLNYLRPEFKHGSFSPEEDRLIIKLHNKWGNKWSCIAQQLPGRTDNEIKNHWRTHIKKMALLSKISEQRKVGRKCNKSSGDKKIEGRQMATAKECYEDSNSAITLNQVSCDTCESDCGYEEWIEQLFDMGTLNNIIDNEYRPEMVQPSQTFCLSSVMDSPLNVLSDSEEFLWDYNYIDLWS